MNVNVMRLRALFAWDQARFAAYRACFGAALNVGQEVSPNLRFARLRMDPGASLSIGDRFATERQPGNHIWLAADARLELASDVWLRTEHNLNRITAFTGAHIRLGRRNLINGAMLHAKREIEIGDDSMVGFGSRIFDADFHPLDKNTPERIQPVKIGKRVWVSSDVTITRGVTIGDDAVIGARAVVTHDIPPRTLALGAPATPIREIAERPTLEN